MKKFTTAAGACFLTLALGCGQALDAPVDPDQARATLQAALDAWRQGKPHGELQQRNPPIYFREPEWEAGKKLVRFEAGPVDLMGRQGRCSVKLSLRDGAGKRTEREISYLIDTTPRLVIVREQLGP